MEKTIFKTGICANCGADLGLHQSETEHCPFHGMEISMSAWERGERQQWELSVFEDSGMQRLHDAAPQLYEALSEAITELEKFIPITEVSVLDKCKQALSAAK